MERDLARHVVGVAFRAGRELEELLRLLKQRLAPDEYRDYAVAIAGAIDTINVALLNRALATHPELAAEIDARVGD